MASYRKRNNGWEYRVSYKKPDGTYGEKSKRGYRTKSEAERAAAEAQRELAEAVEIDKKIELADYFKKWAEIHKKPHVSIGTWKSYQQAVRIVTEYFQHTKLTAVTSTAYQQFLNELGTRYYQKTIHGIHHKIRRSIKQAVVDGYITRNFTELAKISSTNKSKPLEDKFLQLDKYQELINLLKKETSKKDYVHLYLLAVTGMRLGESLGLTWQDIDFDKQLIDINKTWDIYNRQGFKPTKNKQSVRKIPLTPELSLVLKKYKFSVWKKNSYNRLFTRTNHTWLNRLVKKLTDTNIHIHSLRHTYASYLISENIDLLTVSNLLGHKDLTVTLQTYAHQLEAKKEQDFEEIKKLFG